MTSAHDKYAKDYDEQVRNYDCYIADVLFGLSYEYIQPGETLFDIGIGTGISSQLFHLAGLQVFGMDSSAEMLALCKAKGIARELMEQDVLVFPWPYQNGAFNHVICCGVFHFLGDLERIFNETSRIHKPGGIFAFTVMDGKDNPSETYQDRIEDGLNIYAHTPGYIYQLLRQHHYRKEKEMICLVGPTPFRTIVARKTAA